MKKSLVLVFALFTFQVPFAQKNFEWEIGDNTSIRFTSLLELSNGDILVTSAYQDKLTKLTLISQDGEILNEGYINIDSLNITIHKIVSIENEQKFLLIGSSQVIEASSENRQYLVTCQIDANFEPLQYNVKEFDVKGYLFNMNYFKQNDDTIFMSINVYSASLGEDSEQVFALLNKKGEVVKSTIDIGFNCYSIIESEGGYDCMGVNIKKFSKGFDYISKNEEYIKIFVPTNQHKAVRLGKNKILVGSISPQIDNEFQAALYLVDNNIKVQKYNGIYSWIAPTLPGNVFDIAPDSSVFLANFKSLPIGIPDSFALAKFDINLNKIWEIRYGNMGLYTYSLWGMEATIDNGVLIYGRRTIRGGSIPHGYLIKFNSEGNIVWTHNVPKDAFLYRLIPIPLRENLHSR
ncbi:MAG: hypothetical protein R2774_10955 [Saprospiraceae bacterium]